MDELNKRIEDAMKEVLRLDAEIQELSGYMETYGMPTPEDKGNHRTKYEELIRLEKQYPLAQLRLQSLLLVSNGDSSRVLERATKRLELLTLFLLVVALLSFFSTLLDLFVK